MREYAKIGPKFWIGATGKKLRAAGMEAQIVALYLMTSPHANMLGLYYVSEASIAHETGLGFEGASKGLARAIEAQFCEYDHGSEMVWVIEMASYQIAARLEPKDNRRRGVQNEYDSLPNNPFLSRFYDKYGEAFGMASRRGMRRSDASPLQGASKGLRSQEQEQEQEQAQEQDQEQAQAAARAVTAADLSIAMRNAGIQAQPADPRLIALAAQGTTAETVTAACDEARRAKPNERIGAGYVLAILESWATRAATVRTAGAAAPRSGAAQAEKYSLAGADRSGDKLAQQQTIERHGIAIPAGEVEF